MSDQSETNDQILNQDAYNEYIRRLKEDEAADVDHIIIRYISYEPEMAEAALYAAVEKGIISFELKEKLSEQIRMNFSSRSKAAKKMQWETNNAFRGYVDRYTDDEIYNLIEDPSDIVIDVFHAVLLTARDRELISTEDFDRMYQQGLKSASDDEKILKDDLNEYYSEYDEPMTEDQIEAQKEKYWKCPSCSELVGMDLAVCWNCQAPVPDIIEHPATEDIKKELRTAGPMSPIASGFVLFIMAGLVILRAWLRHGSRDDWFDTITQVFVAAFIVPGIALIIYGLLRKAVDR